GTFWVYDAADNLTSQTSGGYWLYAGLPGLPEQHIVTTGYGYDLHNRRTTVTEAAAITDVSAPPVTPPVTKYLYDPAGHVTQTTGPMLVATRNACDPLGRLKERSEAVDTPVARTTGFAYDPADRLVAEDHQRFYSSTDPGWVTTGYDYDSLDRKTA